VLLPTPSVRRRIDRLAAEVDASVVLLDPALPLGLVGPSLERPYGLVVHGAEVTIPGRLPGSGRLLGRVVRGAELVIAAGGYPAAEAARAAGADMEVRTVVVPPGVDTRRFRPLDPVDRADVRRRFDLDPGALVVLGLSRLVPRKGFDRLIDAVAELAPGRPDLVLVIAGGGRDRGRLERRADRAGAPVRFLGRVSDDDLPKIHGAADVFAMICRNRWLGLEQEGFGIVFLEAAACGVPAVAGRSGGSHEAVADGETGFVVNPRDVAAVRTAIARLIDDDELRARMGAAARRRALDEFAYDRLATRLEPVARGELSAVGRLGR